MINQRLISCACWNPTYFDEQPSKVFSFLKFLGEEEEISLRNATQQRETHYINEGTLSISLMQIDMSTVTV